MQHLTVTVNFPNGRTIADLDCGPLNHDLNWEDQIAEAMERNGTPLGNGNGPEWSSLELTVTNALSRA